MKKILKIVILFQLFGTLIYSQMPESKQATLIEAVSSSEWLIEATGKYNSPQTKKKKAKKRRR